MQPWWRCVGSTVRELAALRPVSRHGLIQPTTYNDRARSGSIFPTSIFSAFFCSAIQAAPPNNTRSKQSPAIPTATPAAASIRNENSGSPATPHAAHTPSLYPHHLVLCNKSAYNRGIVGIFARQAMQYFWRVLDVQGTGRITIATINLFFRDVARMLNEGGFETPCIADVKVCARSDMSLFTDNCCLYSKKSLFCSSCYCGILGFVVEDAFLG